MEYEIYHYMWQFICYAPAERIEARWMFSAASVCQFVCLFVRTIAVEWLNVGRSNLAVRCTVQKSRPRSTVKVKGQRSRSPGTEKEKNAESSPLTMHSRACAVARPYAARSNRRYHCVAVRRWRATVSE